MNPRMLKQESTFQIGKETILVITKSFNSSLLSNYKFVNIAIY
jgi:hypothetical protein